MTAEAAAADVPSPLRPVEGAGEWVQEDVCVHMTTKAEEGVVADAQLSMSALPPPATTTATMTTPTIWLIPWTWHPIYASVGPEAEAEMEKAEQEQEQQEGADRYGDNDNI